MFPKLRCSSTEVPRGDASVCATVSPRANKYFTWFASTALIFTASLCQSWAHTNVKAGRRDIIRAFIRSDEEKKPGHGSYTSQHSRECTLAEHRYAYVAGTHDRWRERKAHECWVRELAYKSPFLINLRLCAVFSECTLDKIGFRRVNVLDHLSMGV